MWRTENLDDEYSEIFDKLLATQQKVLLSGGLSKAFSPQITALVLGKHGYHNRTDVTSNGETIQQPVTEIKRRVVKPDDS